MSFATGDDALRNRKFSKAKGVEITKLDVRKVPRFGHRHIQALLLFMVMTVGYITRISLSVTIVAMTDNTASSNPDIVTFNWTNTNVILSSFFWGYIGLQVVGAYFMNKHGPKWYVLVAMVINATAFTLIPQMAIWFDSAGVIVCRVIEGLSQGFFLPSVLTALGRWAPENERAMLSTIAISGMTCGTVIGELFAGYIAASWAGWPAIFYLFGGISFGGSVLWLIFAHNSPATHPTISREEREYIESSLKVKGYTNSSPTPWKGMMTSIPFWALMICAIGVSWCIQTALSETPTYLSKVLQFNIKSNGFISAGPNVLGGLAGLVCSVISDYLLEKNYLSRNKARKIFQIIGTLPTAILIACLGFISKGQETTCVILLFLTSLFQSAIGCGCSLTVLDISPNYSGIIQAFGNTIGAAVAIIAPLYVQFAVTDLTNVEQWSKIFLTSASVYLIGGIVFVLFGSTERQWWDSDTNVVEEIVVTKKQEAERK